MNSLKSKPFFTYWLRLQKGILSSISKFSYKIRYHTKQNKRIFPSSGEN
ncbi:hypothetical protein M128_0569 [Bacteroides fragilis str. S6L8]|uniref:Uncharacterized protein n=2 Tax=Bacteroides fragilis TaxID=817 RepID=A0A016APX2_BACFG|nr:hypothetical protein M118_0502 [Bacteroides fragilis str. 3783N1-2]EXY52679.1 hypothetical protein M121_0490 [Bacteroides fragilis str. 3783N2-1]EXY75736.1 hypothetical protein M124_0440 [Bacteroides fragilis str. 3988T(B)14]EXZ02195.1 hypothetical protein M074_0576 [Bacteroides fragilis str. DS-166]EXZ30371.1 hypothetical protein M136_0505 [Bacteroides fragilis str. S36L11]EYA06658.1 hypothetical protein M126_0506 [Bacteroides fragilis str. S6L3]EYA87629.1 hypothetical protein M137_0655 [